MKNIKVIFFELLLALVLLEICFYGLLKTANLLYIPALVVSSGAVVYILFHLFSLLNDKPGGKHNNYNFYIIDSDPKLDPLFERIKGRM